MKSCMALFFLIAVCTCIDPYDPQLKGNYSLLVVDGMITDRDASYEVRLSTTFQDLNASHTPVISAYVFITDDAGNNYTMYNHWDGSYRTESSEFIGIPGRTYVLHILTSDGEVYESEPCLMQYASDIDSIYFARDQKFFNNGTESQEGITIYLDSKEIDDNQPYRWEFEETWKSIIPFPQKYIYIKSTEITDSRLRRSSRNSACRVTRASMAISTAWSSSAPQMPFAQRCRMRSRSHTTATARRW